MSDPISDFDKHYGNNHLSFNDPRPNWDDWFMTLAFVVSQRSLDKHTKHGCVVVSDSNSILSVGYNSPPRGVDDNKIPLDRPFKYVYFEHAESNSISNAARCGISIEGSTFYVTGPPCHDCFRKIINVGAKRLVQGPVLHQRTEEQINAVEFINQNNLIQVDTINDLTNIKLLLSGTQEYISRKSNE